MTSLSNCNVWRHNWRKFSKNFFWILFPKMTLGDGPKMLPIGVKSWLFFKFDILYDRYNFRIRMSIPFKTFQNLRTYSLSYTDGIQYESWTMITKSCSNVIVQKSQSVRSRGLDIKPSGRLQGCEVRSEARIFAESTFASFSDFMNHVYFFD